MRTHDSSVPVITGRFLTRCVALWAALAQRRVGDCSRDDVRDDARSIGMLSPTVQACEHHSCESMRLNFLPYAQVKILMAYNGMQHHAFHGLRLSNSTCALPITYKGEFDRVIAVQRSTPFALKS